MRGNHPRRSGPYPLGEIPDDVLIEIGKQVVHRLALGTGDIKGDDFGTIFAHSIGGTHRSSPLGVADVECGNCAWSVKTVKGTKPFTVPQVRLISGRNSPDYSHGIANPRADIQATGRAVLTIWNERVNEALKEFDDLRIAVLIRNIDTRQFVIFEEESQRFVPNNYEWSYTPSENLAGRDRHTGVHHFTWQPHGGQFTVLRDVPPAKRRFTITREVPTITPDAILESVGFGEDWIDILP